MNILAQERVIQARIEAKERIHKAHVEAHEVMARSKSRACPYSHIVNQIITMKNKVFL